MAGVYDRINHYDDRNMAYQSVPVVCHECDGRAVTLVTTAEAAARMSPQEVQTTLIIAFATFVITLLTAAGAIIKLLPGILERREQAFETKMQSQRADEEAARKEKADELALQIEETRASIANSQAMSTNLQESTRALIAQSQRMEAITQQMAAGDKALTANTQALGDMAEHLGVLLRTGSMPLQELITRVKRIDEQGTTPLTHLQKSVDEIKRMIEEIHTQVMPPGQIITTLTQIRSELETALGAKIDEAVEVKRKTAPIPVLKAGDNPA